jgi:hypothetical protein
MLQYYKPNSKNTGHACSVRVADKEFFIEIIKQASWDPNSKTGSFAQNRKNPAANTSIKINTVEAAGIIDTIETNRPFSAFHSTEKTTAQINFDAYIREGNQIGFSFRVSKGATNEGKASFVIGFTFPEARLLKEYLQFGLGVIFQNQINHFEAKRNNSIPEVSSAQPTENSPPDFTPSTNENNGGQEPW